MAESKDLTPAAKLRRITINLERCASLLRNSRDEMIEDAKPAAIRDFLHAVAELNALALGVDLDN